MQSKLAFCGCFFSKLVVQKQDRPSPARMAVHIYETDKWSDGGRVAAALFLVLLGLLVICGNCFVIGAQFVWKGCRRYQFTTRMLMVNLAIADLGNGLTCIPTSIYKIINKQDPMILESASIATRNTTANSTLQMHNATADWFLMFTICFFLSNSITSMTMMTVDRFVIIKFPLRNGQYWTKKRCAICIAITWIISLFIGFFPYLEWFDGPCTIPDVGGCDLNSSKLTSSIVVMILTVLYYGPCITTMVVCYSKIYTIAKGHKQPLIPTPFSHNLQITPETGSHVDLDSPSPVSTTGPPSIFQSQIDNEDHFETMGSSRNIQLAHGDTVSDVSDHQGCSEKPKRKITTASLSVEHAHEIRPASAASSHTPLRERRFRLSRQSQHSRRSSLKFDLGLARNLLIIMFAFLAFTFPFQTVSILAQIGVYNVDETIKLIFIWLFYANSVCNPVIYCIRYKNYRCAFRAIIKTIRGN